MELTRAGFILYVLEYPECVSFYRDTLELPVLFDTEELTCFEFGSSYLMVEFDDREPPGDRGVPNSCLRMNVPSVRQSADWLVEKGVAVDYQEHGWGTIAKFYDPAGNLCAFKDDELFERQVRTAADR